MPGTQLGTGVTRQTRFAPKIIVITRAFPGSADGTRHAFYGFVSSRDSVPHIGSRAGTSHITAQLLTLVAVVGLTGLQQLGHGLSNNVRGTVDGAHEPSARVSEPVELSGRAVAGLARIASLADALTQISQGTRRLHFEELSPDTLVEAIRALPSDEPLSVSFRTRAKGTSVTLLEENLRNAGLELPHLSKPDSRHISGQGYVGFRSDRFVNRRDLSSREAEVRWLEQEANFKLDKESGFDVYQRLYREARDEGENSVAAHDEAFYAARLFLRHWFGEAPAWVGGPPDALRPRSVTPQELSEDLKASPQTYVVHQSLADSDVEAGVWHLPERYRRFHRVEVREGLLYDFWGNPLTTPEPQIYALTFDKQLLTGFAERDEFHHSTLLGGRGGLALGELEAANGMARLFDRNSGHYEPFVDALDVLRDALESEGADLSQTVFDPTIR